MTFSLNLYFDFHFPLSLIQLITDLLNNKNFDPKNPAQPVDTTTREWYSQPRPPTNDTVEVINMNYKLPMSVSEFSVDILRESCHVEVWYKDRSNNIRQVLDRQRVPLTLDLSKANATSWYTYTSTVYPIVAKSIQLRIKRNPDPQLSGIPYSVGARNTLVKRNVYDRTQGVQDLGDEQDVLGNVISKTIKDWDAAKAIDANTTTFWRSAPMPDPSAVASLYLDVRTVTGLPQTLDKLYIDPVHSGQMLNLYYSSDETVGIRKLSPIQIVPDSEINTDWRAGRGRWDLQGTAPSRYAFTSYWGPQYQTDAWVGFEWTPDFDATAGPSQAPVLLRCTPPAQQQAYSPDLSFDPGAGQFTMSFRRPGFSNINFTAGINQTFKKDEPLRVVMAWAYGPKRIILQVRNRKNEIIASTVASTTQLPDLVSFDGQIEMSRFRGLITAQIIKFDTIEPQLETFMSNPVVYVSPEPTLPDNLGNIPSSSLDNAVYSADFTQQRYGVGGPDHTEYSDKEWTPIWKNYTSEKGMLFFPQMVTAKYLKLEFTNLTEEPYPVYESGIDVAYKVFPISVQQVATIGPRLFTGAEVGGLGGSLNGIRNPFDIFGAIGSALGTTYDPVQISTGNGYTSATVPHTADPKASRETRVELSSKQVYRRDVLSPYIMAQNQYYTTVRGDGLFKLAPYTQIPWQEIYAANPGALETKKTAGAIPVRGTNYWVFPGQSLRIPAQVMERLTSTSTVTERRLTLETRVRFTTTAVHKYETRTVRRDAAIAYFAGVREVIPFVSSYVFGQDKDYFDFPLYSSDQWTLTNIRQVQSGPITWDGAGSMGTAYFPFRTYSNFTKLFAEFRDSGLIRSDALWASAESDMLTPAASIIPSNLDGSAWLDSFVDWKDTTTPWGATRGVVAVNLDGDRRYQGRRVLHFTRVAGAGEAGLRLNQKTNYVKNGLFRLGCVVYKPFENTNILKIRLTRKSDSVIVYETPVDVPVGRWVDFTSELQPIPGTTVSEMDYNVELVLTGDKEDELYVSDLYSEVAHVRYFIRLGGSQAPLHEVTELRFKNSAYVVAQAPVTEGTVQASILSPKGFAYGTRITPDYRQ